MKVHKQSCLEGNMATHPELVHPHLRLREPDESEVPTDDSLIDGVEGEGPAVTRDDDGDQRMGESSQVTSQKIFKWKALPPNIKLKILKMLLVFPKEVVHAISRLDPYCPPSEPEEVERDAHGRPKLLHRFHIGRSKVSLTSATKPQDLLKPLLISRWFAYVGVHLFYGLNAFVHVPLPA